MHFLKLQDPRSHQLISPENKRNGSKKSISQKIDHNNINYTQSL